MEKLISIVVLIILAASCFMYMAGKDSIKAASEQPMRSNVEQSVERKIP